MLLRGRRRRVPVPSRPDPGSGRQVTAAAPARRARCWRAGGPRSSSPGAGRPVARCRRRPGRAVRRPGAGRCAPGRLRPGVAGPGSTGHSGRHAAAVRPRCSTTPISGAARGVAARRGAGAGRTGGRGDGRRAIASSPQLGRGRRRRDSARRDPPAAGPRRGGRRPDGRPPPCIWTPPRACSPPIPHPALSARAAVLEAEVAFAGNDVGRALPRRRGRARVRAMRVPEVRCHALELVGRMQRISDLDAARDTFERALAVRRCRRSGDLAAAGSARAGHDRDVRPRRAPDGWPRRAAPRTSSAPSARAR